MKKIAVALLIATCALTISPALAATPAAKVLKVLPAKPFVTTTLSGSAGDQLAAMTTTPISIVAIGTVESTTSTTGTTGGATDGFIESMDYQGAVQWSLHLGGAGDEIATAIVKDKAGGYLVVGAASATPTPGPVSSVDTGVVVNPDGVTKEQINAPTNSLSQLTLWRVSTTGQLISNISISANGVVNPTAIVATATGYLITGDLYQGSTKLGFSVAVSSTYQLGNLTSAAETKIAKSGAITSIKAGTMIYKSYLSSGAIKGIPSWKPRSEIPVIVGYNKLGAIKSANYLHGKVVSVQWQSGKGLVILTEQNDGYGLTLI